MKARFTAPWAVCLAVLLPASAALACQVGDSSCPAPDPCAAYTGTDYGNCRASIPSCPKLTGPPLSACLAHQVALATGTTKTQTSTGVQTGTTTNRATNWTAVKTNDGLFSDQANNNSQAGNIIVQISGNSITTADGTGTFLNQNDAFAAQAALLKACAGTNLSGRTDALCVPTPNDPECTGMSSALGNATTCAQPGPIDPATGKPTCLAYGSYGYGIDEWLVFGQQYFNSLTGCLNVGNAPDATGASANPNQVVSRQNRLQAFSGIVTFPPSAPSPPSPGKGPSTITGKPNTGSLPDSGSTLKVALWKNLSAAIDDGSSSLGYERGELIRRSAEGQTFSTAFSDSPFAESLNKPTRDTVEAALANPSDVTDRVKERKLAEAEKAKTEDAISGPARAPALSDSPAIGGRVAESAAVAVVARAPASVAASGGGGGAGGARAASVGSASVSVEGGSSEASKASDLAAARSLLGEGSAASANESTLFERVSLSYRRHAKGLRSLGDSNTARDLRTMETPAFFKNL
ncbi:MAG: hypothetical protein ACXVCI_00605 [Bdellovibrionota bacterium]